MAASKRDDEIQAERFQLSITAFPLMRPATQQYTLRRFAGYAVTKDNLIDFFHDAVYEGVKYERSGAREEF